MSYTAEGQTGQHTPANTRRWTNAVLMLGQRRRRWANINTTLGHRLVFAVLLLDRR